MDKVDERCGQPKRGPCSELEAGDDDGGACAFNKFVDLYLFLFIHNHHGTQIFDWR
jgi:hypothetical protein